MINKLMLNFHSCMISLSTIQQKIFFVVLSVIIFRIGTFIPIPGIDTTIFSKLIYENHGTILEMLNIFSGGALNKASIFSLGIMPYISSSIIIQLLIMIIPKLSEIKKEGESGRYKINQYTRLLTLILVVIQSIVLSLSLPNMPGISHLIIEKNYYFYLTAIFSVITGSIFLMWLSELITSYGIGNNGTSVIIFIGIISSIPNAMWRAMEQLRANNLYILLFFLIVLLIYGITWIVVFIEKSQRKIEVYYSKRQKGRKLYAVQNTHLPLKVNIPGVIPAIFASSVILFPATILTWFGKINGASYIFHILTYLQPNTLIYTLIYSAAIFFFCFLYTGLIFSSRETADNLKKSGAFIPGIRPGEQTSKYISKIVSRLTLIGSFYIIFICLVPEFLRYTFKVPFYFGGTSLLIVVVVIIDFISHVQTLILSNKYKSILKKSNLNFKNNNYY